MSSPRIQLDDLLDLADILRQAGYNAGAGQCVAAQDLLILRAAKGQLPEDPRAWRPYLAPLFCAAWARGFSLVDEAHGVRRDDTRKGMEHKL
ncbi:MAG: hypothetical protein ACKV2V_01710 [Blastocatellia bacterium]